MPEIVAGLVVFVLFIALAAAILFRSWRHRDRHYPPVVPLRQSLSSPIGTSEVEWGEPELELRWVRDRSATNLDTGLSIEQHDEIFVKGPPDAVMRAAELTDQAMRDPFSSAHAFGQPYEAPALERPEPASDMPLVLASDQYEELPESPLRYHSDWQQDDEADQVNDNWQRMFRAMQKYDQDDMDSDL
jgi:hypothetical protein